VLVRDLRTRMRGARAYVLLAVYLSIIAVVLACVYYGKQETSRGGSGVSMSPGRDLSRAFYTGLFVTQAGIVVLFVPAFTAGALTIEHEQQTFDMLVVTRLTPSTVVWGRLASSVSFTLLLLLTALPLVSVCFLLGGVAPLEVLSSYLALMFCAFVVGSMGILSSTLVTRTVPATILTFTFVFVYLVGTLIAGIPSAAPMGATVTPFVCLNPFLAIFYGSDYVGFFAYSTSVPAWLTGAAVGIVGSLLLLTMAVDRLGTYFREREPWRARLLLMLLLLLTAFLVMGWVWAMTPTFTGAPPAGGAAGFHPGGAAAFVAVVLTGIGLLAPMMCTSEEFRVAELGTTWLRIRAALSPLRILRPGPLNGTLYLLAILVISVPILVLGLWLGGASTWLADWGAVAAVLAIGLVGTLCCIALTWALFALFGKRPAAAGVAYGLMFVTLAVPPWFGAMWATTRAVRSQPADYPWVVNLTYLDPLVALLDVATPEAMNEAFDGALAFQGIVPFHVVTIAVLAALTVLFMAIAAVATAMRRARALAPQTPVPPPGAAPGPYYGR
jgi:ABC-type transport system involved in multi-copper enzyme maturation permease subunit